MTDHQILTSEAHRDVRVLTEPGAQLGDGVMACLAIPPEFRQLACEFPIVFRRDAASGAFSALALFGFEPSENLFLDDDKWGASYRPLALAIQPFLVGRPQDADGSAQVHIDMGHPRIVRGGEGMRLFDDDGRASPYLEQISGMLGALDEGYRASGEFFAALDRYDLLEPFSMDVSTNDGAKHRLVGYHLVNEETLRALEPGALADLHARGYLLPIFMTIASLGNLGKLVQRKNQRAHG